MKFMFGKKNINVTAYTFENGVYINDAPVYNKADNPEWIRTLKNSYKQFDINTKSSYDVGTAKLCPGIRNYLQEGIHFNCWTSIKLRIHPSGFVENLPQSITHPYEPFVQHSPQQFENIYPDNKTAFKLNNPWIVKCTDRKVKFLFAESHYSTTFFRENDLTIAPGLIDFYYQNTANVHIVAPKKEEPYELIIPYGTPLFTLYPLSERPINFNTELVSSDEFNAIKDIFPNCPMKRYFHLIRNLGEDSLP
jgi:hypothetical protein